MKTKQVLSVEQMKHLQELGLDMSDASIYWARVSHGSRIDDKSKGKWFMSLQKEFQICGFTSYETLPAYTLQDILNKLPESIQIYNLYIFKQEEHKRYLLENLIKEHNKRSWWGRAEKIELKTEE